jgi:zinc transport system substrate-binding protein
LGYVINVNEKNLMKKIFFGIIILIMISGIILLIYKKINQKSENQPQIHKLQVVTTLFPIYDFAKVVGQDKVNVTLLLPPGVEAHSFEPKPDDVARINHADIFIYTGKFMEAWAENIITGVTNKNLSVVDASRGITLIPDVFHDSDKYAGLLDPHIWLDFTNSQLMVDSIAQAFSEKDPENKLFYAYQAAEYNKKLSSLDDEYSVTFKKCKSQEIIYGGHYAFGYLAHRYGIKYLAAQGISPDAEPTASDLAALVNQIKKDNIKYVFYEELTSPKIAQTLSGETKTKLLQLNAAHNISKLQLEKGISFLSIMKNNLDNLKVGLRCQ